MQGKAEDSRNLVAEVQEIDVVFTPEDPDPQAIAALGLLGRMATTPAIFEPFRNPVTAADIRNCIGKLVIWQAEMERQAKREDNRVADADLCQLWILTPTASMTLLAEFGATIESEQGIYSLPGGFKSHIVVIHQLPVNRDTLWLRLLGRGNVQKRAIAEVSALPDTALFKDSVMELLADFLTRLEAQQNLEAEDRELIMQLSPVYLERIQEATEQGMARMGLQFMRRRFGAISPDVEERVRRLPASRLETLGEIMFDFESEADLVRWLDESDREIN